MRVIRAISIAIVLWNSLVQAMILRRHALYPDNLHVVREWELRDLGEDPWHTAVTVRTVLISLAGLVLDTPQPGHPPCGMAGQVAWTSHRHRVAAMFRS